MEIFEILGEVWAVRALIASSLVGIMCGALGAFIVLRNMSMIGDALSHAILPGVVVAFVIIGYSSFGFFIGAVAAGLVAAVGITWIQDKIKTKNDAAIGIVFTAMFSIGVIGISWISKNEGVHLDLKDFLFGNILGVSDQDLLMTTFVALFVIASIMILYRYLFISTFQPTIAQTMGISVTLIHYYLMLLLSFAVVASLQTVGVILVVAMLITPASTALLLSDRLKMVIFLSAIIGLISAVGGLISAILVETTPGPAMAVVATIIYLITALFAPRKGLIARNLAKRSQGNKILREDILKQSLKLAMKESLNFEALTNRINKNSARIKSQLNILKKAGLFTGIGDLLHLTEKGRTEANALVRAHRLWESYLVQEMGLNEEQIHEDAEKFEHLLTEELIDEVDATLGYPGTDPHGSPIPAKEAFPSLALSAIDTNEQASIAGRQVGEEITHELWKMGLLPGTIIKVHTKNKEEVVIEVDHKELSINRKIANQISVKLVDGDLVSN